MIKSEFFHWVVRAVIGSVCLKSSVAGSRTGEGKEVSGGATTRAAHARRGVGRRTAKLRRREITTGGEHAGTEGPDGKRSSGQRRTGGRGKEDSAKTGRNAFTLILFTFKGFRLYKTN